MPMESTPPDPNARLHAELLAKIEALQILQTELLRSLVDEGRLTRDDVMVMLAMAHRDLPEGSDQAGHDLLIAIEDALPMD